ncbi:MAG: panC [Myxococcaceae bacterium]|nr:panC [Myxococcaceae bacterium]
MQILSTVAEVQAFSARQWSTGKRLALVPTMGFLHEGHLSLIREGAKRADGVATTIFVNPTQFGPTEDLSRYPRDLQGDLDKCQSAGATVVFTPEPKEIYPPGFQTSVEVTQVSQGLCGEKRPGHFKGVATVVTKLLAMFRPHLALFGEKDYQQLQVIKALNADLNLGVEIVGMPTVREPDGLALSSRNTYLSADERRQALALSRGLKAAQALAKAGERDAQVLLERIRGFLTDAKIREDYVALVNAQTLQPLLRLEPGVPARALIAAFVGKTRLIDNLSVVAG